MSETARLYVTGPELLTMETVLLDEPPVCGLAHPDAAQLQAAGASLAVCNLAADHTGYHVWYADPPALQHAPGTETEDHLCQARIWAKCRACGVKVTFCTASSETIALIRRGGFRCSPS